MSRFFISIGKHFDVTVECQSVVAIEQFVEGLVETLRKYSSSIVLSDKVADICVKDVLGNYCEIYADIAYLAAWVCDDD